MFFKGRKASILNEHAVQCKADSFTEYHPMMKHDTMQKKVWQYYERRAIMLVCLVACEIDIQSNNISVNMMRGIRLERS